MHRRITLLALFTAFAATACSTDSPTGLLKAPTAPSSVIGAGRPSGNYVVVMKSTGLPDGFAANVATLGGKVTSSHAGAGIATVSGLTDVSAAQLATTTGVSEVDPDAQVRLDNPVPSIQADAASLVALGAHSQTDPAAAQLVSWQWDMRLISADKAWAAHKLGSPRVTVAILDTGIDYDNPDLNGLVDLHRSTSFMNTFIGGPDDPVTPSDDDLTKMFFPHRNKISDYNGHGTNVAATVSSNASLFAGVGAQTTLIGVKVLGANGSGSFGGILNGILFAADHGADVANMSLGGDFQRAGNGQLINAINRVFDYAEQKGMLIVVAAGNEASDLDHNGDTFSSFCDAPHVICVSSVGPTKANGNGDIPAFYSNFGRMSIDVAGPGGNEDIRKKTVSNWPWGPDRISWVWSFCSKTLLIFSPDGKQHIAPCASGDFITAFIGTSQATPHVAGLAGLIDADHMGRPEQVKNTIEMSGDPINPQYGRSRINVSRALGLVGGPPAP